MTRATKELGRAALLTKYKARYERVLRSTASNLEDHLRKRLKHVPEIPRLDRVCARAKDPKKFLEKAFKVEGGKRRYTDPWLQVQDQIGARIIVFFPKDIEAVKERIKRYFTAPEQTY